MADSHLWYVTPSSYGLGFRPVDIGILAMLFVFSAEAMLDLAMLEMWLARVPLAGVSRACVGWELAQELRAPNFRVAARIPPSG